MGRCLKLISFAISISILQNFAIATSYRTQGGTLIVNGVPTLTIRSSKGSRGPAERASVLAAALNSLPEGKSFRAKRVGRNYTIFYGSSAVVGVDRAEALAEGTSTASIAARWVANLRRALAMPPLKLDRESAKLATGMTTAVRLVGSMADRAVVQSSDDQVAGVKRTPDGFLIVAGNYGDATIAVSSGGIVRSVIVKVMPYAVQFPQTIITDVTGAPATSQTVRGAIHGALRTGLASRPLADWKVKRVRGAAIAPGESRTYTMRIAATAPECLPSSGLVTVVVHNVGLSHRAESELWYSNVPESVKKPENLFSATLKVGEPARLLYHHVNDSRFPLAMRIVAVNESDREAKVIVIAGDAKPDRSPVLAGYLAAEQFVPCWATGSGEVVAVPPHTELPLSLRRLPPGVTMSGLCSIQLLDGGPVSMAVRVDARQPVAHDERYSQAMLSPTPWHEVGCLPIREMDLEPTEPSDLVFPHPYLEEETEYKVGGRYAYARIGQTPIARVGQGEGLQGNYGVLYSIKAHLENPTQQPADVELVYESSAGYSSAVLVVDGETKNIPLVKPGGEAIIERIRLEPGRSRIVSVFTFPLSGGSYPVTFVIRPVSSAAYQTNAGRLRVQNR